MECPSLALGSFAGKRPPDVFSSAKLVPEENPHFPAKKLLCMSNFGASLWVTPKVAPTFSRLLDQEPDYRRKTPSKRKNCKRSPMRA